MKRLICNLKCSSVVLNKYPKCETGSSAIHLTHIMIYPTCLAAIFQYYSWRFPPLHLIRIELKRITLISFQSLTGYLQHTTILPYSALKQITLKIKRANCMSIKPTVEAVRYLPMSLGFSMNYHVYEMPVTRSTSCFGRTFKPVLFIYA